LRETSYDSLSGKRIIPSHNQHLKNHAKSCQTVLTLDCKSFTLPKSSDIYTSCRSVPVGADKVADFQTAQLVMKDRNPVWAFCRQVSHCSLGMVFAVNAGTRLAAFQAAAKGAASPSPTVSSSSVVSAPLPTSSSTDHKIIVGGPNLLTFSPTNITAQVGDTIIFEFHQKNHTVTSSSFDFPCQDSLGFDSGL
jgi:plastocyanin